MRRLPISVFLGGLFLFPFLNFARFSPLQDWWTNSLVLLTVGIGTIWAFERGNKCIEIPRVVIFLLFFLLYLIVSGMFRGAVTVTFQMVGIMLAMMLMCQCVQKLYERQQILTAMAWVLLLGSVLQSFLGILQIVGIAHYFNGWVLFEREGSSVNVIGNVGQRNQYAHYLTWGVLAVCYLFGLKHLGWKLASLLLLIFCVLISFSGARLPLIYSLSIAGLTWFWHRRSRTDEQVTRMAIAVVVALVIMALCQIFSHNLGVALHWFGLNVEIQSGADRLLDAGFGARRRIEWAKALQMFREHPVLGYGMGGYAYRSAWLEAFGGFPKVPEDVLFTQSHNLVFQLLSEVGGIGTLIVLGGLLFCLLPFFYRGRQSGENLFLIGIAAVILLHSLLEFPLWYLPFLAMLTMICAFSPIALIQARLDTDMLCWVGRGMGGFLILYVLSGAWIFSMLTQYNQPSNDLPTNQARIANLQRIALLPWWQDSANLVLINYVQPSREFAEIKLNYFEQLVKLQPFSAVLFKLAMQQALSGEYKKARASMAIAIANYPGEVNKFAYFLRIANDPSLEELQRMTQRAAAEYAKHGVGTEEGRIAAVMAVSTAVTRSPLF
ncbi:PglL family O-oligosaccharyltransferase [Chromobacterium violaceum]|uniref:PglL family O-oligosaccharyltransferase n=1 Tax=Chromobacterium violaceum TaxID=536 RepID=UPI001C8BB591|nr:Wzy polymerase domain-containing protein [Chromobacterium violaceum]MBX9267028.1 O-antigen ligase C-terminal domain-containing protein [Chromobacterium violaceum]